MKIKIESNWEETRIIDTLAADYEKQLEELVTTHLNRSFDVTYIDAPDGGYTDFDNGVSHWLIKGTDRLRKRSFSIPYVVNPTTRYTDRGASIKSGIKMLKHKFAEIEKLIQTNVN